MCQREGHAVATGLSQGFAEIGRQVQIVLQLVDVDHDRVAFGLRDLTASEDGLPQFGNDQGAEQPGRFRPDDPRCSGTSRIFFSVNT